MSVNLSPINFQNRNLAAVVAETIAANGLQPDALMLEITESVLMNERSTAIETMKAIRELGVGLSLDDFGTGYSSLSYLQRYPIDKIKIDRSFIANLGIEKESAAVVQAIVKLARALKLDVIAEGVETIEQRDQLIDIGCEEIQGYLYSRPVDAESIGRMYNKRDEVRS